MVSSRPRAVTLPRRWGVLVTAVLLGAGLLAGCGSGDSGGAAADLPGSAPVVGGTFPATVEHAFGTTTIPAAPARIVTVGYTDDQAVLAFGGKPVGMTDQYTNPPGRVPDINTQWPWVKDLWGDARPEVVFTNGETAPNYEKIASLRPDLIIAVYSEIDKAGYDQLSAIAPTVARTKTEAEPFSAPWQDNAVQIASALGKRGEGEQAVRRIDAQIAQARQAHPQYANQTAVALSWYENQVTPFTSTDVRGRLLTGMGFRSVPAIDRLAGPGEFSVALSPERLDLLNVDRIFVINDAADQQAIKNDPLFANLPAVKAGRVSYLLDSEGPAVGAALSQTTVPSLPYAIDGLVRAAG
jgi:iron complex transport system substrate-binding protein